MGRKAMPKRQTVARVARPAAKGKNLCDPERSMPWSSKNSSELHRSYGLNAKGFKKFGFGLTRLPANIIALAKKIRTILDEIGPGIFTLGGFIFNTMESDKIAEVKAEQAKQGGNLRVDEGRSMVTDKDLKRKSRSVEVEEARVELNKMMKELAPLLMSLLKDKLLCDQIIGYLFSALCSEPGTRAQLVHCDLPYNQPKNKKYKDEQLLVLFSLQKGTEIRVVPGSHAAKKLAGVKGVCEKPLILILDEFDLVAMHPKLFHAGGECKKKRNYRLHFYFGFGARRSISGKTHYLPDEAISASVGSRNVKAVDAKKANKIKAIKVAAARANTLAKFKLSKQK